MAATFADLTEEVCSYLRGFTADQEQHATLATTLTTGTLSFSVDDGTQISRGLIEVDSELMHVQSVVANTVTIPAWGRAQQGSVAATHAIGAKITAHPRNPRHRVKAVINEVIRGLFPQLYAVKTTEALSVNAAVMTYAMPADLVSVISVSWEAPGPSQAWVPVNRYRVNRNADSSAFPTGRSLDILSPMQPGAQLKIVYRAEFSDLVSDADLLTASGLPESARDLVVWGALAQLLPSLEFARLNTDSVQQSDRQRFVPPGSASAASRQAMQMMALRLEQERLKLAHQNPMSLHLTR